MWACSVYSKAKVCGRAQLTARAKYVGQDCICSLLFLRKLNRLWLDWPSTVLSRMSAHSAVESLWEEGSWTHVPISRENSSLSVLLYTWPSDGAIIYVRRVLLLYMFLCLMFTWRLFDVYLMVVWRVLVRLSTVWCLYNNYLFVLIFLLWRLLDACLGWLRGRGGVGWGGVGGVVVCVLL